MGEMAGFDVMQMLMTCAVAVLAVVAAWIDARERRFPNGLALVFASVCAVYCLLMFGVGRLVLHAAFSAITCGTLVGFEMLWRRSHKGVPGLGMGDVKFLGGFMLAWPFAALVSFALGLLGLAVAGVALKQKSLPLLPFVVGAAGVLLLAERAGMQSGLFAM